MTTSMIGVSHVSVQMEDDGDAIVRMTNNGKNWEPETRAAWHALVKPGEAVLDVGAYTGIYSIASALMGAHVTSLEPHPANYQRLRKNAGINSVKLDLFQVAASDKSGLAHLFTKARDRINDTASLTGVLGDGNNTSTPVMAKRLDDMAFKRKLGLIKIDVEHHEAAVLMGGFKTILKHRPLIVVEVLNPADYAKVDDIMQTLQYRSKHTLDKRNRLYVFKP